MVSIEILRGYSASGKSTYARQSGSTVVSRDAIRAMLTGSPEKTTLGDREMLVSEIQEAVIRAAIKRGEDVVVDDTNLAAKYARRFADLAVSLGVFWWVRDFKSDMDTCLARNAERRDSVPEHVIINQAERWPINRWAVIKPSENTIHQFKPYVPDTSLPKAVGFDLDGTLAHMVTRGPYDTSRYHEDAYDDNLRRLTWRLSGLSSGPHTPKYRIIIFSGRSEEFREVCETWLRRSAIHFDLLVMRKEGDKRRDDIVKSELFDEFIAPNYNFLYTFDDRQRVVDGLRSKGITVYQVAPGNF